MYWLKIRTRSLIAALVSALTLSALAPVSRCPRVSASPRLRVPALPPPATPQADNPLVFRNVDVFDGSRVIRNTNVVVRDGMIRLIGQDVALPWSAELIDGKGKTLLPGLIDAHVHLGFAQGEKFLRDAMVFGVTTEVYDSRFTIYHLLFNAAPQYGNPQVPFVVRRLCLEET